jgi:mannitol-1-phosphate/altronate dehydrogenase
MLLNLSTAGVPASFNPSLHPEGHMKMWYASPLTRFDPHLMTALFIVIIVFGVSYFLYVKRKHREKEDNWKNDKQEKQFQDLMAKKEITLRKLLELEEAFDRGELNEKDYEQKAAGYKTYLHKVKKQLNDFLN